MMLSDLPKLLPEIEAAAVRGWPALETEQVDGWLYRYSSGGSLRANTVATLQFTGANVEASIDRVEALAREHNASAGFTISRASQPADLDQRLAARGYARGDMHITMVKAVAAGTALPSAVDLAREPSVDWLAVYLSGLHENRRLAAPQILNGLPPSAIYVSAVTEAGVVTSGLTIPDGPFASVQCVATLPGAERRGMAQRVLQAIEHLAGAGGQSLLYLQTSADNIAACALYEKLGFVIAGTYHTRIKAL